tara:strand:- start:20332 stop:20883 length:552 start_codon:yes stop_codon:yes gene_type:complete
MAKKKAAKKKATRKTTRRPVANKPKKKASAKAAPAISPANKKRGRGRPPFEPTEEQRKHVETLAGFGLKHDEIRHLVENPTTGRAIDEETLRRHFADELARGGPRAAAQVAQSLFRKAIGDGNQAVTAAIWYSKCRMGWKERVAVDVDVKSGVLVTPAGLSPADWIKAAAERAIDKKEPGADE